MADGVPEWACVPAERGWCVHQKMEDGTLLTTRTDAKAGLLLGRNNQICDFEVNHKSASRVHACLAFSADGVPYCVDMGSTHGTFVDGARLEKGGKAELIPGKSVVHIGRCSTEYVLLLDSSAAAKDGAQPAEDMPGVEPAAASLELPILEESSQGKQRPKERQYRRKADEAAGVSGRDPDQQEPVRGSAQDLHATDRDAEYSRGEGRRDEPRARQSERGMSRDDDRRARPSGAPDRGEDRHRNGATRDGRSRGSFRPGREEDRHRSSREPERHRDHRERDRDRDRDRDGREHRGASSHRHRKSPSRRSRQPRSSEEDRAGREERQKRQRVSGFDGGAAGAANGVGAGPQLTPAQIVMSMMGGSGAPTAGLPISVEQKKKLLWGKKAAAAEEPVQAPVAAAAAAPEAFGANRWDTAEFSREEDKEKFIKLMGVKQVPTVPQQHEMGMSPRSPSERAPLPRDQQARVLHDIEGQFMAGLRRADGRTVGLGL